MSDTPVFVEPVQGVSYGFRHTPSDVAPQAAPPPPSMVNQQTFKQLAAFLGSYGLGSLFSVDDQGLPAGWLWDQITNGVDSEAVLTLALESTPQWQQRYGIITEMRNEFATGKADVVVPTMEQVRDYETQGAQMMKLAGFPTWFYDSYQDMQGLMRQGVSLAELQQRVGESWSLVNNTDPAVVQAFEQFYGMQGEAALASFYLDPDRTIADLDKASRTAYAGGMGKSLGLNIDKQLAERMADLPDSPDAIVENLTQVAELQGRGVFNEGITETADLTAETEGVGATVFGDGAAAAAIERRIATRRANAASSTGGAALTSAGQVGARNV